MDKLRSAMEAAIREQWQQRPNPISAREPLAGESDSRSPPRRVATAIAKPPAARSAPAIPRVVVSAETFARQHLVAALPESPERHAYCLLQRAVMKHLTETGMRVIGVTSPSDGCGKTLTAANLAISLAIDAHRPVMLIDLDLRGPAIHSLFELAPVIGIEDCLFNGATAAEAVFSPAIDDLTVLPARGDCTTFSQVMRSAHLRTLLDKIKSGHPDEILVIDLPSMTSAADGRCYEALVDGVVLVVEDETTRARDYKRAIGSLSARKLIGTVLNRVAA